MGNAIACFYSGEVVRPGGAVPAQYVMEPVMELTGRLPDKRNSNGISGIPQ